MAKRQPEAIRNLVAAGFQEDDAIALRRAAMRLHRWYEEECGFSDDYKSWSIIRDEETGKPYREIHPYRQGAKSFRESIPDWERGAEASIKKVMSRYPEWATYLQTDPRGAPLYVIRKSDIPEGAKLDSCYNRGIAVFK